MDPVVVYLRWRKRYTQLFTAEDFFLVILLTAEEKEENWGGGGAPFYLNLNEYAR